MGGWVGGAVRLDVNAMFGVGGDVGYGGCEPRIEDIVQCTTSSPKGNDAHLRALYIGSRYYACP